MTRRGKQTNRLKGKMWLTKDKIALTSLYVYFRHVSHEWVKWKVFASFSSASHECLSQYKGKKSSLRWRIQDITDSIPYLKWVKKVKKIKVLVTCLLGKCQVYIRTNKTAVTYEFVIQTMTSFSFLNRNEFEILIRNQ